jgi:CheY-like chemotaxis protein/nitrogen-specific signal transduction histidine kinase
VLPVVSAILSSITVVCVIAIIRRVRQLHAGIKARDDRIATVVHELRGALQPITLAVARLKRDGGLSARQLESVEIIERNVEAEARLVEDLFEATRGDRPLAVSLEPCDLNAVAREVADSARPRAAEKSVEIEAHLDPVAPRVMADPVRLRQVVRNLVDNAVKFTPPGGRVSVRSDRGEGRMAALEVADTGAGIAPEDRDRIFDPYAQLDDGRAKGGLGLGLFLARKLVLAQHGEIAVTSEGRGRGSRFLVSLPRAAPEAAPASSAPAPNGSARILLAEDHEDSARMVAELLSVRGYAVTSVGSVATALAEAARSRFDVLVADLELPDGSGFDLLRKLRANGRLGAVALSGRRTEADLAASRAAGFGVHLAKPIDFDALVAAIEQVRR